MYDLKNILEFHEKWLNNEADGKRADLRDADLSGADLRGADLRCADLRDSDLSGADLRGADLRCADLRCADLRDSDLRGADLSDSDLSGAMNIFNPIACPEYGEFIGWKKARGKIVKLKVTENAKRCSATGRKCRCSEAVVLAIENIDGSKSEFNEVPSDYDSRFLYRVGQTVKVENFNNNRWIECCEGIHFFITREEAERY